MSYLSSETHNGEGYVFIDTDYSDGSNFVCADGYF